jgi:hypothetical protein
VSPADLATLSLLDPDQGVCPDGHPCRLDEVEIGYRRCTRCDYAGMPVICWEITEDAIQVAEHGGADARVVWWARDVLADRAAAGAG